MLRLLLYTVVKILTLKNLKNKKILKKVKIPFLIFNNKQKLHQDFKLIAKRTTFPN